MSFNLGPDVRSGASLLKQEKGNIMKHRLLVVLGGVLVVSAYLASMAFAKDNDTPVPSCSELARSNGLVLTNTRIETRFFTGCPDYHYGVNGPSLMGSYTEAQLLSGGHDEILRFWDEGGIAGQPSCAVVHFGGLEPEDDEDDDGSCPPWTCGQNGTALTGTRLER